MGTLKRLQSVIPAYPKEGEIFELTLDGDAHPPLEMVRRDGYGEGWSHSGPTVKGVQTRRFKLVSVGYCRNLEEVRQRLAEHGEVPPGQWREVFNASYPKPDDKGPVGVADPSWVNPGGRADFPYVNTGGYSSFYWAGDGFSEYWRWLVAASK